MSSLLTHFFDRLVTCDENRYSISIKYKADNVAEDMNALKHQMNPGKVLVSV